MTRFLVAILLGLFAVPLQAADDGFLVNTGEYLPPTIAGILSDAGDAEAYLVHFVDCDSMRCEESLKAIQDFVVRKGESDRVAVLGIAVGSSAHEAGELSKSAELTFPLVPDANRSLFSKVAENGVPRTLIADSDRTILYRHVGYDPGREAEFRAAIDMILRGDSDAVKRLGRSGTATVGEYKEALHARDVVGQNAPEIPVEKWINPLGSTEGKFLLVDFWATWCGPCRQALEFAEGEHTKYADKLATMAISDEPEAKVLAYVKQKNLEQPIAIDTQARGKSALSISAIPHALLIDPSGKVVFQGHPMTLWGNDAKLLKEYLNGPVK